MKQDQSNCNFFILILDLKIQVGISKKPFKKYCDITGFESKYIDPKTNMKYYNFKIFSKIKTLSQGNIKEFLSYQNK